MCAILLLVLSGCFQSTALDEGPAPLPGPVEAEAPGRVLYLAFDGLALDPASRDDATEDLAAIATAGPADIVPFDADPGIDSRVTDRRAVIFDIAARVRSIYAAFDLRVVTERPGSGAFTTVAVGGLLDDLLHMGACAGGGTDMAAGLAAVDCDDDSGRNVGVVAPRCLPLGTPAEFRRLVAVAAAHEAGHTFGLEHVEPGSGSLMQSGASQLRWGRGEIVGASECGRRVQDDVAILRTNLGEARARPAVPPPPDRRPPSLTTTWRDGDVVPGRFVPCIDSQDPSGIRLVVVQVFAAANDGTLTLVSQVSGRAPGRLPAVDVPAASVELRTYAVDGWDNVLEHRARLRLDPAAPAPACP